MGSINTININTIESISHVKKPTSLYPQVRFAAEEITTTTKESVGASNLPNTNCQKNLRQEESPPNTKTQTCRHYKNNTCQFGISGEGCEYSHPKRCTKLMKHGTRAGKGCNKGSKCTDFHPKMCPMSISRGECLDASCTLCHVKGTRRRPPKPVKAESQPGEKRKENTGTPASRSPTIEPPTENRSDTALSTGEYSNNSFLLHINLLRKELQEAMDKKLETLMAMQSPQISQQPSATMQMRQFPNQQLPPYAPIPWMHPLYQRNPYLPMGF